MNTTRAPKGILFTHLLNDLSGSPRVLRQVVDAMQGGGTPLYLASSESDEGFLNDLPGVEAYYMPYHWSSSRLKTLLRFIQAQWYFMRVVWRLRKKVGIVYINTVLPVGSALAAWALNKRVVYHLHESELSPRPLSWLLFSIMHLLADHVIFVSEYLREKVRCRQPSTVVYNSLDETIAREAIRLRYEPRPDIFTVLMVCSWKAYKGVYQFLHLARQLPDMHFNLILNADEEQVWADLQGTEIPRNITFAFKVRKISRWYAGSHVILNLSLPDQWVETFGLTLLEGMAFGLPALGPAAGGVKEVITDGVNGYWVDPYNTESVVRALNRMHQDEAHYQALSTHARASISRFSLEAQLVRLSQVMAVQGIYHTRKEYAPFTFE